MSGKAKVLKILADQVKNKIISPEQEQTVLKSLRAPEEMADDVGSIFEHEQFVPIGDYIGKRRSNNRVGPEHNYAFDKAAGDVDAANNFTMGDIMTALGLPKLPPRIRVESEFAEFDSPNPNHANARFNQRVMGLSPNELKRFKEYFQLDDDDIEEIE